MEGRSIKQKIFSLLRVRSIGGGLEITDQVIRLAIFDGKTMRTSAVRLEQGILNNGAIVDGEAFRTALQALRKNVVDIRRLGHRINVAVVLSSVNVYSQVFTLPMIEGADFVRAVDLNVQMLSPMDAAQVYSGWQTLGRDEKTLRVEMLAAFVEKKIVDAIAGALFDTGFLATSVESRALALARLIREQGSGIDPEKSYLVVSIGNAGIEFLVMRRNNLYFEYASSWANVMDERGEISIERFTEALIGDFRQVSNFYGQHWSEPLSGIILSAAAFQDAATDAVSRLSSVPVLPFELSGGTSLPPEWFPALGCGLRMANSRDQQINLLGGGAQDIYREEEILSFLGFWRTVVPIALGLLVVAFALADSFLLSTKTSLEADTNIKISESQLAQVAALTASATAFNAAVSNVAQIESSLQPKYIALQDIESIAASSSVHIVHMALSANALQVMLSGTTSDQTSIIAFKDAIQNDLRFGVVNLPITNIQQNSSGYSFTMDFPLSPSAFRP